MFYVVLRSGMERDALMAHLKRNEIQAIFHYIPLHSSPYFLDKYRGRELGQADHYSACILRLPFYTDLSDPDIDRVINGIHRFYNS